MNLPFDKTSLQQKMVAESESDIQISVWCHFPLEPTISRPIRIMHDEMKLPTEFVGAIFPNTEKSGPARTNSLIIRF